MIPPPFPRLDTGPNLFVRTKRSTRMFHFERRASTAQSSCAFVLHPSAFDTPFLVWVGIGGEH